MDIIADDSEYVWDFYSILLALILTLVYIVWIKHTKLH